MHARIHDDEPDTDAPVVAALLESECPHWASRPLSFVDTSGTDNAMWRVHLDDEPDVVVRLPRRPGAAAQVEHETKVLRAIAHSGVANLVATPRVRHLGQASGVFPHRWSVLEWIDGTDTWHARRALTGPTELQLAEDLGHLVLTIGAVTVPDHTLSQRDVGDRGGPLEATVDRLLGWLDDPKWLAADLVDVDPIRRLAAEGREVAHTATHRGCVHGDLIPGNLLVRNEKLSAVIDWGNAALADRAQDLTPAWSILTASARCRFRDVVKPDEAAWIRGRTIALEQAVGGVLYYRLRHHPLGDIMQRTLDHILQ